MRALAGRAGLGFGVGCNFDCYAARNGEAAALVFHDQIVVRPVGFSWCAFAALTTPEGKTCPDLTKVASPELTVSLYPIWIRFASVRNKFPKIIQLCLSSFRRSHDLPGQVLSHIGFSEAAIPSDAKVSLRRKLRKTLGSLYPGEADHPEGGPQNPNPLAPLAREFLPPQY
jgi:hypothetical protein